MTPLETKLIAVGPWQDGEFAVIRQELDPLSLWLTAPALSEAVSMVAGDPTPPEVLLLAQPRPVCDCQSHLERLRRSSPLTRVIVVAGSWCEGELRTGRPPTGAVRLYWYEFPAWWRHALALRAEAQTPPWAEPLDDARAGQLCRPRSTPPGGRLAIDTVEYNTFEALADGLAPFGWTCRWEPRHRPRLAAQSPPIQADAGQPYSAGLWDGGQLSAVELASLRQFAHQMRCRRAPTIALVDFPRAEHIAESRRAGAAALLGKPYQLMLLHEELLRACG